MALTSNLRKYNEHILRNNPFDLSDLNGKTVTLVYGKDGGTDVDLPWETLGAVDDEGKIYVLISREAE